MHTESSLNRDKYPGFFHYVFIYWDYIRHFHVLPHLIPVLQMRRLKAVK